MGGRSIRGLSSKLAEESRSPLISDSPEPLLGHKARIYKDGMNNEKAMYYWD